MAVTWRLHGRPCNVNITAWVRSAVAVHVRSEVGSIGAVAEAFRPVSKALEPPNFEGGEHDGLHPAQIHLQRLAHPGEGCAHACREVGFEWGLAHAVCVRSALVGLRRQRRLVLMQRLMV